MDTGLTNKVILVTGASGGIGSEIVTRFAAEGARVVIHYHKNKKRAVELLAQFKTDQAIIAQADLRIEEDVQNLFVEINQTLGPVEILIANSGVEVSESVLLHQMSFEQWKSTLDSNLNSMFLCLREFIRGIEANQLSFPSAVLMGSTAAQFGEAGHSDYAASKSAAIYGLMLSLKNEMTQISPGARINAVSPGWTLTPMAENFLKDKERVRQTLQTIALKKFALSADVAQAAIFLASSKLSGHITGQILTVSGGMEGRVLNQGESSVVSR